MAIAFDIALETIDDVDQESLVDEGLESTTPVTVVSSSQTPTTSTTTTTTTTTTAAEQTSKPTTQITTTTSKQTTTTTSEPTTTTTQPPGPLKCSTCNVDEIGPYALKAGSGGCIRTRIRFQITQLRLYYKAHNIWLILYIVNTYILYGTCMSSLGMRAESLKEEIQTMPITHRFTIIANV